MAYFCSGTLGNCSHEIESFIVIYFLVKRMKLRSGKQPLRETKCYFLWFDVTTAQPEYVTTWAVFQRRHGSRIQ